MSVVALLVASIPVAASEMDDRIELSARKSHVFKTYLSGDDIKIQSKDGAVTLTGTVSEEFHKSLAYETVAGMPGVKSVDNRLEVKGTPPAENSGCVARCESESHALVSSERECRQDGS
jgi:osmotically-inducible protein OsmY